MAQVWDTHHVLRDSSGPSECPWPPSSGLGGDWSCQRLSSFLSLSLSPMQADPTAAAGCLYESWVPLPMSTSAPAPKKMDDAHHLPITILHLFPEHFPGGGIPGDILVGPVRREFTEHLLCARYCAILSTFIISFTPSNNLEG